MASSKDEEHNNFSRLARVIVDLCGDIQKDFLSAQINPASIPPLPKNVKFNAEQNIIFAQIPILNSYDACDNAMLYSLIRNMCRWVIPTNKWNKPVDLNGITIGDDIERLRLLRNNIYGHAASTRVNNNMYLHTLQEIENICIRFDGCHSGTYLQTAGTGTYTNRLTQLKICCMDTKTQSEYVAKLQKSKNLELGNSIRLDEQEKKIEEIEGIVDANKSDLIAIKQNEDIIKENQNTMKLTQDAIKEDMAEQKMFQKTAIDNVNKLSNEIGEIKGREETFDEHLDEFLSYYKEDMRNRCLSYEHFSLYLTDKQDQICTTSKDRYINRRYEVEGMTVTNMHQVLVDYNSILLKAEAGMGKSEDIMHFLNMWSNGEILSEIRLFLHFQCRNFNHSSNMTPIKFILKYSSIEYMCRNNKYRESDIYSFFEHLAKNNQLMIAIDGIDEINIGQILNNKCRQEIKEKVYNQERMSGEETVLAIFDGTILSGSRLIITGRISAVDQLENVQELRGSPIFERRRRKVLRMLKFSDDDIRRLICRTLCGNKHQLIDTKSCEISNDVYKRMESMELKSTPCFCKYLIQMCKDKNKNNFLDCKHLTKSKLILALFFHRIKEHGKLDNDEDPTTFQEIFEARKEEEIKKCLKGLMEISQTALINNDIKIYGEVHGDVISIGFTKISYSACKRLDLFYIRKEKYYKVSIEPHHLLIMEFLAACKFALSSSNAWEILLSMNKDRQLIIFPMIAGIMNLEAATMDFFPTIMDVHEEAGHKLQMLYGWLLSVKESHLLPFVRYPDIISVYQGISRRMPVDLLVYMIRESSVPPNKEILPKYLECYCPYSVYSGRYLIDFNRLRVIYDVKSDMPSSHIENFLSIDEDRKIAFKGNIKIGNNKLLRKICRILQKYDNQFCFMPDWVHISCDKEEEKMAEIVAGTKQLEVAANIQIFSTIMNDVQKRSTNSPLWSLLIVNNIQSINPFDFNCFISAAFTVKMVGIKGEIFTEQQWNALDAALISSCNKSLEWLSFYELVFHDVTFSVNVLSLMKVLTFYKVHISSEGWNYLAKIIHGSVKGETNPYTSIIHQFQSGYEGCVYKNSSYLDAVSNTAINGILMLDLIQMKMDHITPQMLITMFRNVRAVRLILTTLTQEQWHHLGKNTDEEFLLQEMWLKDTDMSIDNLKELTYLKILRFDDYPIEQMLDFIRYFKDNQSSKRLILTRYKYLYGAQKMEVIDYNDSLDKLQDNSKFMKIQQILRDENNSEFRWNLEIHSPDINIIVKEELIIYEI